MQENLIIEQLDYVADVYDITVEDNHNFFANDILVHNCSEIDLPTSGFRSVKELYESYKEEQNYIKFKSGRKEHIVYSFDRLNTKRKENIHALKLQEDDVVINDDGTETVVDKVLERSTAGEIALCNIGGIIVSNIKNDEEYYNSCYRVLKMVRFGILNSSYVFQNLKETAEARMNAGIGIVGLAHLMAKKGLSYSSQEGRDFCHELAETHYWHLLNASLELSKEYGVAKWMYKTKWVDGWTPLDTYCKAVDELVTIGNKRDWKGMSEKIKANGGILNSVLCAHMPSESCLKSTTYIKTENGNMSLEEIFNLTGADLEKEVEDITPLTGGKWFKLPEPIMVETMDGLKPATDVWLNGRTNYMEIELEDGAVYKVTHHHKFLVKSEDNYSFKWKDGSYQWKMAINLNKGDVIARMDSNDVKIKSIKVTDDRIITMDINVDEVHHYILEDGTVSHNSSISGATTNGLYPIRDFVLNKTNETQSVSYVVPDSTKLRNRYESAWDIPTDDMTKIYAIFQKWCDQGISADRWRKIQGDEKVGTKEMITGFNLRYKYGLKQGYYQNTKGGKDINLNSSEGGDAELLADAGCESCSI